MVDGNYKVFITGTLKRTGMVKGVRSPHRQRQGRKDDHKLQTRGNNTNLVGPQLVSMVSKFCELTLFIEMYYD